MHTAKKERVNINCDLGEAVGNDAAITPFIDRANIACGYHAGDRHTMEQTIALCCEHKVAIGAHPSFLDRENFGRKEIQLPQEEIYELVMQQLIILNEAAEAFDKNIEHVKPHGALYNMSARDPLLAGTIARAVRDFDDNLILMGLSGSHSIIQAEKLGLKTFSEAFADRSYQDDGSLTPRSEQGALIHETEEVVKKVLQMVNDRTVTTVSGKTIPIIVETICIHGDGEQAVEFARAIYQSLKQNDIDSKVI